MNSEHQCINDHGYLIVDTIASTANRRVYRAIHTKTKQICCIKVFKHKLLNENICTLINEVQIHKSLDHPLVVQYFETFRDYQNEEENTFISMEYLERGTLLDYVNSNVKLGEDCCKSIFTQIITALDYLHSEKRIVHRDIKAENILLDQNFNIRICDFDLSTRISGEDRCINSQAIGSLGYMAPEVIKKECYNSNIDIWSTGVLLFALLSGYLPFDSTTIDTITNQKVGDVAMPSKIVNTEPIYPDDISEEAKDLMKRMLKKNPAERITLKEIINHTWFDFNQHVCIKNYAASIGAIGSLSFKPDDDIVEDLNELGYSTDNLNISLFMKEENDVSSAFRILRRRKIQNDMIEYCSSSNSSECEVCTDSFEIDSLASRLSILSPKTRNSNMLAILLMGS
jgi:5'-AMP-activated protein kinase catalytic alpha subunit